MDIAMLGMGRMGRAVARRLLAGGYSVVVWNRSPGRVDEVVAAGAKDAGLAAGAARATGVELPRAELVEALYRRAADTGAADEDIVAVAARYRRGRSGG